jgi:hypothetical protein
MGAITPQNFNRLAKAMMQRHHVNYSRAGEMLGELKLRLACDDSVRDSAALQAAVLTAINAGKRAFRGGVTLALPSGVALRLAWPGAATLNDAAASLGASEASAAGVDTSTIYFGTTRADRSGLRVLCDGWRGGVVPTDAGQAGQPLLSGPDFAMGGVFAGALAVARRFLSAAQISNRDVAEPTGLSLWRPDLPWLDANASGPPIEGLPAKLWLLGLGHLGQAYAWTLGLLPVHGERPMTLYLQDYDVVEDGNWSAGLLCELAQIGRMKTRMSADWLEARGFRTRILERPFEHTHRVDEEPRIALCGFDNAKSRTLLEDAGFDLVVDCGLGSSLDHFDRIVLRTFPDASVKARDVWAKEASVIPGIDPALLGEAEGECGIVLQEIAGKAISSSFTGACASALAVAELLRAVHGGQRCEFLKVQLRDLELPTSPYRPEHYQLRVARNGTVPTA